MLKVRIVEAPNVAILERFREGAEVFPNGTRESEGWNTWAPEMFC